MKNINKKQQRKTSKSGNTKKASFSIGYLLLFLVVLYVIQMVMSPKADEIPYSQFRKFLSEGKIADCSVGEKIIKGHYFKESSSEKSEPIPFMTVPIQDTKLVNELENQNIKFKGEYENPFFKNMLIWWVFPFAIIFIAWFFISKNELKIIVRKQWNF